MQTIDILLYMNIQQEYHLLLYDKSGWWTGFLANFPQSIIFLTINSELTIELIMYQHSSAAPCAVHSVITCIEQWRLAFMQG